jgi:hypothetical protein
MPPFGDIRRQSLIHYFRHLGFEDLYVSGKQTAGQTALLPPVSTEPCLLDARICSVYWDAVTVSWPVGFSYPYPDRGAGAPLPVYVTARKA